MSDSREATRDDDDRLRAAHIDGLHEALQILDRLRWDAADDPHDPRLLGLGLAVDAIRGALRAKGAPVAGDPVRLPAVGGRTRMTTDWVPLLPDTREATWATIRASGSGPLFLFFRVRQFWSSHEYERAH